MKSKRKMIAITVSLVLVLACLAGATLAYFTDTEFNKNNVITIGDIEIDLYEHSKVYDADPGDDVLKQNDEAYRDVYLKETNKYLLPGQDVAKYTYINNTGDNEAYVRFVVAVPAELDEFLTLTWNEEDYNVTDGEIVDNTVVYYCVGKEALAAGALSAPGLINVALNADLTEEDLAGFNTAFAEGTRDFNITVAAHAIQTVGFNGDVDAAFEAFDANPNEKVEA